MIGDTSHDMLMAKVIAYEGDICFLDTLEKKDIVFGFDQFATLPLLKVKEIFFLLFQKSIEQSRIAILLKSLILLIF